MWNMLSVRVCPHTELEMSILQTSLGMNAMLLFVSMPCQCSLIMLWVHQSYEVLTWEKMQVIPDIMSRFCIATDRSKTCNVEEQKR
jgi:flagellar biosynthesis protein FliR